MKKTKNRFYALLSAYWRSSAWHKLFVIFGTCLLITVGTMYGIARWYIASTANQPKILGASFIPAYAESFGLNAQETMDGLINDVGVRHFRLVSYWSQLEPQPGEYDFSILDWQIKKAEDSGSKVTLSLGLRQPRWPECHMPTWAEGTPQSQWQPQLEAYIAQVVNRYKHSPALDSYQLENEFFLKGFGDCEKSNFDRSRLVSEYNLVRKLDPHHKLIISRSNNALGVPIGKPTPDEFGISIYKRVWDATLTKRYVEYPFPAWYYAFVAGAQKIVTGKDMIIHELQAESWGPRGQNIGQISLTEANKSFNETHFTNRLKFAEGTGMREVYLWGAEYWYFRLVHEKDPSLWNVAKEAFHQQQ